MRCVTCHKQHSCNCHCDHWDFVRPINRITVTASGSTTDLWVLREYSTYTAEVVVNGEVVTIPLCFHESDDASSDPLRPDKKFLKNLRRSKWECVSQIGDVAVYENPNPFYYAKLTHIPRYGHYQLRADAVTLTPDDSTRGCGPGGRALLVFGEEIGDRLTQHFSDSLVQSSAGSVVRPYHDDSEAWNPSEWQVSEAGAQRKTDSAIHASKKRH